MRKSLSEYIASPATVFLQQFRFFFSVIVPVNYNQTAENILSLIPGTPEEQSDLIVKILGCGILALGVFLSAVTNTSIRGGRGVFYRT